MILTEYKHKVNIHKNKFWVKEYIYKRSIAKRNQAQTYQNPIILNALIQIRPPKLASIYSRAHETSGITKAIIHSKHIT